MCSSEQLLILFMNLLLFEQAVHCISYHELCPTGIMSFKLKKYSVSNTSTTAMQTAKH
jgi:hypothetical protein